MNARRHCGTVQTVALIAGVSLHLSIVAAAAQTITIDNDDSEFQVLIGTWETGTSAPGHWETDYRWRLTTGTGAAGGEVEWRPNMPAGAYEVSIYYPEGGNRADNAPFTVHFYGGSHEVLVNQQNNGGQWNPLGVYTFASGSDGYVTLSNDANSNVVIADAVRFTRVSSTVGLTMDADPIWAGETSPAVGGPYNRYADEVVPISATPDPGYVFDHWEVSAGSAAHEPSLADTLVTMDQAKTVTAVFVEAGAADPEFRGFWADAFHEGFKSTSQIDDIVARALAGNYNAIIPEVLAYQDTVGGGHGAYWDSDILPMATDISVGLDDPLDYLVQQAHANGLEVHVWLVAYRVCTTWPPAGNSVVQPEWIMVPQGDMGGGPATVGGKYTLDPGCPAVQEYLISIVRELATNYEIDGVHWDYIRYTSTDAGYPAYTWYTDSGLERFKRIEDYSGTPSTSSVMWSDFRRREVTELVRRAQVEVATITANPRQPLRHSAALITWGNAPSDFEDTNAWGVFQNWGHWMEEGYLDTGIPMTYYSQTSYPTWYRNWVDQEMLWRYDRHMVVGPGIYLNTFANSLTQMTYARNAGANGMCTYSYAGTSSGGTDWSWYSYIAANLFDQIAPVPTMPWRDPATATEGVVYGRVHDAATGAPLDDATVSLDGSPIVQTDGNGFYLLTGLSAGAFGTITPVSATADGYSETYRPYVLVERAGYTEVNFGLGSWLPGDYDVDADVDLDDYDRIAACITGPDNGPPLAGCDLFDFDADDDVDLADIEVFVGAFTG